MYAYPAPPMFAAASDMYHAQQAQFVLPPPPVFAVACDGYPMYAPTAAHAGAAEPLNLDDIFEEFWPNDEGDANTARMDDSGEAMRPPSVPSQDSSDPASQDSDEQYGLKKNKRTVERRERNREHAKKSRVRKKFLLDSLQQTINSLEEENEKLRQALRDNLGYEAEALLEITGQTSHSILANNPMDATKVLDDPDYGLVKALQTAQQNFVITDPTVPDNPIVYASGGFLQLTGYTLDQVLGRNCRFLQGPDTDPGAVAKIRKGIETGEDTTVVLLNYRTDGSTFWNQFFIAALRDSEGNIVNYLGVQCMVSDSYAMAYAKESEEPSSN